MTNGLLQVFIGILGLFLLTKGEIFIKMKMRIFAIVHALIVLLMLVSFSYSWPSIISFGLIILSVSFLLFGLNVIHNFKTRLKNE